MTKKFAEIGEFALIRRLERIAERSYSQGVLVGIGDDAAVVRPPAKACLLTTDVLVDGIHFRSEAEPGPSIGHRAMAASISDVAAMGGTPLYAVVALSLPGDARIDLVEDIYSGLVDCASRFGAAVVGGDISGAPCLSLAVTLLGEAGPSTARRSSANDGDAVLVTGYPGESAAGLQVGEGLPGGLRPDDRELLQRHLYPEPRLREAQAAVRAGVHCLEDVSDGVARELVNICEASGLGAVIDESSIPISTALESFCARRGLSATDLFLGGGEDFELVATCGWDLRHEVGSQISANDVPVSVIGRMSRDMVGLWLRDEAGALVKLEAKGWEHFGSA